MDPYIKTDNYKEYIKKEVSTLEKIFLQTKRIPLDIALDIGCGEGLTSIALTEFVNSVIAVDPSFTMIEKALSNNVKYGTERLNIYPSSAETLPKRITRLKYDVVLFAYSLHYVKNVKESIDVVKSLLKPNGIIIIILPNRLTTLECTQTNATDTWLSVNNVYKTVEALESLGLTKNKRIEEFDLFIYKNA